MTEQFKLDRRVQMRIVEDEVVEVWDRDSRIAVILPDVRGVRIVSKEPMTSTCEPMMIGIHIGESGDAR